MSGIINSTGAKSGVIGTTVGTPAGHVIKVHQQQTPITSSLEWTSGTNEIQSYTFTPDTRTTNLMISCYCTFQLYGNSSVNTPHMTFNMLHNGTNYMCVYDFHHNYGSTTLHSVYSVNFPEIIAENHASASGSREVVMNVEVTAGRFYILGNADELSRYSDPKITIMELA